MLHQITTQQWRKHGDAHSAGAEHANGERPPFLRVYIEHYGLSQGNQWHRGYSLQEAPEHLGEDAVGQPTH